MKIVGSWNSDYPVRSPPGGSRAVDEPGGTPRNRTAKPRSSPDAPDGTGSGILITPGPTYLPNGNGLGPDGLLGPAPVSSDDPRPCRVDRVSPPSQ